MSAIESFARIPRVLAILDQHPDGLPIDVVARELGVGEKELRRDIVQYYGADIPAAALMGLQRAEAIEFLAADGAEDDPALAPIIRVVSDRPEAELGVEYLRADQLAALYEAARSLAELEPGNAALASAVARLGETFLNGQPGLDPDDATATAAVLRGALDDRREVEIEYSRAWRPGVQLRTVQPYSLHHTARGWEMDAGPLQDGRARTFIVDRIRSARLLDSHFERPPGVAEILRRERSVVDVELSLPQRTHWVADRFAERTRVIDSDATDLTIRASFLPPVDERVGLVLLIAGADAFVVTPAGYGGAAARLAERLLAHHRLA